MPLVALQALPQASKVVLVGFEYAEEMNPREQEHPRNVMAFVAAPRLRRDCAAMSARCAAQNDRDGTLDQANRRNMVLSLLASQGGVCALSHGARAGSDSPLSMRVHWCGMRYVRHRTDRDQSRA